MGELAAAPGAITADSNCIKEECGWWDEDRGVCDMKVIAEALAAEIQSKGYRWKKKGG